MFTRSANLSNTEKLCCVPSVLWDYHQTFSSPGWTVPAFSATHMTNEQFLKHLSKFAPICPCLSCTGESRSEDVSIASRCFTSAGQRGRIDFFNLLATFFLMPCRRLLALFFNYCRKNALLALASIQTLKAFSAKLLSSGSTSSMLWCMGVIPPQEFTSFWTLWVCCWLSSPACPYSMNVSTTLRFTNLSSQFCIFQKVCALYLITQVINETKQCRT